MFQSINSCPLPYNMIDIIFKVKHVRWALFRMHLSALIDSLKPKSYSPFSNVAGRLCECNLCPKTYGSNSLHLNHRPLNCHGRQHVFRPCCSWELQIFFTNISVTVSLRNYVLANCPFGEQISVIVNRYAYSFCSINAGAPQRSVILVPTLLLLSTNDLVSTTSTFIHSCADDEWASLRK